MIDSEDTGRGADKRFPLPSIEEQAMLAQKHQVDVLLFCPDPWALRHRFVNQDTGEVVRTRCNSWQCLYCGPRKVDQWRQLVKAAEPTLFVTLTKVGWTIHEASRVYTTVLQYLRRGSKGFGPDHLGARLAYPLECFAVLEEHRDFEHVGFHWHLLVKGVDYLPKQTVSNALRSATNGRSYIVHVDGVKKMHAIGYVTKYLTKEVTSERRGMREELREMLVYRQDEQGQVVQECSVQTVQVMSKARRIRYTRHFFPTSTAELRLRLFSQLGDVSEIAIDQAASPDVQEVVSVEGDDQPGETEHEVKRSAWVLYEQEPFSSDIEDYRARRQLALVESLAALQAGKSMYSRRVVSIWAYQRGLARTGKDYGKPLQEKEQR